MAPEDNSTPLQTMSYWIALSCRESCSRSSDRARETPRSAHLASRTDCARSRSSSPPRSIRTSENRRSSTARNDPFDQTKFFADLSSRHAGEFQKSLVRRDEENCISIVKPSCLREAPRSVPAQIISDWASPTAQRVTLEATPFLSADSIQIQSAGRPTCLSKDVTEPWLALALRPGIHAVAESARCRRRCRDCPHSQP